MNRLLMSEVMTPVPVCIEISDTIANAVALMQRFEIRHLPVMKNDSLAGILSDRDIKLALALRRDDMASESVRLAYTPAPYSVGPRSRVLAVIKEMEKHKYGCAVVVQGKDVKGIFTLVDALRILIRLLQEEET